MSELNIMYKHTQHNMAQSNNYLLTKILATFARISTPLSKKQTKNPAKNNKSRGTSELSEICSSISLGGGDG